MLNLRAKYPTEAIEIGEGYACGIKVNPKGDRPQLLDYKRVPLPFRRKDDDGLWADYKLDERFQEGINTLIDWMGKVKRLSIVLPDTASKTFFLDVESDHASAKEMRNVILFKIQKFAPINMDGTALAYRKLAHGGTVSNNYLALISSRTLTGSYEKYFSQSGIHVGSIESASLCSIGMLNPFIRKQFDENGNFAVVRVETGHFTTTVFNDFKMVFSRTRLSRSGEQRPEQMGHELKTLSLFTQDKLGGKEFDSVYFYGPGSMLEKAHEYLVDSGMNSHKIYLDSLMDVPNELLRKPEEMGKMFAAVSVATRG